jgi:hypothetical protein
MSNQKPNNPSAYPQLIEMHHSKRGMTLRDHFAGLAMQGFISTYSKTTSAEDIMDLRQEIALLSYVIANQMLKERLNEPE